MGRAVHSFAGMVFISACTYQALLPLLDTSAPSAACCGAFHKSPSLVSLIAKLRRVPLWWGLSAICWWPWSLPICYWWMWPPCTSQWHCRWCTGDLWNQPVFFWVYTVKVGLRAINPNYPAHVVLRIMVLINAKVLLLDRIWLPAFLGWGLSRGLFHLSSEPAPGK